MAYLRLAAWIVSILAAPGIALAQSSPNPELDLPPNEIPAHLVKILRTSSKEQTNRYVPVVYEFQNVNPYAVIRWVRRVMEIEEGVWFAFANPELSGGKLLVACPEYQLPGLNALMELIDREGLTSSQGSRELRYRLRHRDAFDPGMQDVATQEGSPEVLLIPDDLTNSWFLKDASSAIDRLMESVVERYDLPTPQLEARIQVYEVDLTDDGRLGLDYIAWKNGPGRNLGAVGVFAQKEKISTLDRPPALLYRSGKNTHQLPGRTFESTGRNGAYFYDLPSAYFDFLVTQGQARVVTRAKLVALNRNTALLSIGEEILFFREQHVPDLRGGARIMPLDPFGDLEALSDTSEPDETTDDFQVVLADHPDNRTLTPDLAERSLGAASTGLFIQFTPIINRTGVDVDFSMSIVNHTGYADDGTPTLSSRSHEQRFQVPEDSREITLGGLVRKRRIDSANKMPWLGDIPILGYLFGGESRLDQKSMVLATFSARVLELSEDQTTSSEAPVNRPTESPTR